jgi:hypothetical protein
VEEPVFRSNYTLRHSHSLGRVMADPAGTAGVLNYWTPRMSKT